jgi:hypothetical protein
MYGQQQYPHYGHEDGREQAAGQGTNPNGHQDTYVSQNQAVSTEHYPSSFNAVLSFRSASSATDQQPCASSSQDQNAYQPQVTAQPVNHDSGTVSEPPATNAHNSSAQALYLSSQDYYEQYKVRNHQLILSSRNRFTIPTRAIESHMSGSEAQGPKSWAYAQQRSNHDLGLPHREQHTGNHASVLSIRQKDPVIASSSEGPQSDISQNYYEAYATYQASLATSANQAGMSYPYDNSQYNYAPGAANPYAQQGQQSYDQAPPAIRNPFPAPPPTHNAYGAQNSGYDPEHEAQMAQWQSQYAPVDAQASKDARGKGENPNTTQVGARPGVANPADGKVANPDKEVTVIRQGGGQTWEDKSLLEWDPSQFRIMVGNLAGEVTDDSLAKAFASYGVAKARVVRDKRTTKSKGYGFVAFTDGEQGFKAARDMTGKYIGSHPVTIQRSKTELKPTVQKDKYKGKGKHNKNRNDKKEKKQEDPLRAHTGAVIEKKPVKAPGGYKVIG